jgi:hypothetical protein
MNIEGFNFFKKKLGKTEIWDGLLKDIHPCFD